MKIYFLLFILITRTSFLWAIDTKAEQAVVVDSLNNEIIFEKNAKQKIVYLMDPSGDDEHHSFVGTRDDIS